MQETKNSSWYSTVAGALFAFGGVMELFQWLRILRFMSFSDYVQMLIWVASCAVLAFALLTKRRDIFLPVGFALAGIACLFFLNFRNVLLLLLFTCGIWLYIWIYRVTGYTNNVEGEENRNPTNKLLLCLFVPFYVIYWMYKTAQRLDKMAAAKNIPSDLSTLCLILAIFVPIIPPILMQDKLNDIVTGRVAPAAPAAAPAPAPAAAPTSVSEAADDLLKLKELLDAGILTQEEFDAKKKQLLGL